QFLLSRGEWAFILNLLLAPLPEGHNVNVGHRLAVFITDPSRDDRRLGHAEQNIRAFLARTEREDCTCVRAIRAKVLCHIARSAGGKLIPSGGNILQQESPIAVRSPSIHVRLGSAVFLNEDYVGGFQRISFGGSDHPSGNCAWRFWFGFRWKCRLCGQNFGGGSDCKCQKDVPHHHPPLVSQYSA